MVMWVWVAFCGLPVVQGQAPHQASGFKVGEVTATSAIVWTRLTQNARRNSSDGPMVTIRYAAPAGGSVSKSQREVAAVEFPEGLLVSDIRDAVPGVSGEIRVGYRPQGGGDWQQTPWKAVDPARDFTQTFPLLKLRPDSVYQVRVESRTIAKDSTGKVLEGRFRTAPPPTEPARVVFTVSTGQAYGDRDRADGYEIYPRMLSMEPSFFVHTGDIVYYDALAKTVGLARYHWQRTYSLPTNVEFHQQVGSYFIKDDHDTLLDDCWPTMEAPMMGKFTFAEGQAIFREQVPMSPLTHRTFRWGKDLQIWLVEGRDFRSPNPDPDGPEKSIWGTVQKAWFKQTVKESDTTFRVLISPTPLVGPDRRNKNDNHANLGWTHEGDELRDFISRQKDMLVICGDRHWQYASVDPRTGLKEFCCGPASDQHAGGWKDSDFVPEYHRFLKVAGGFLSVTVERVDTKPTLTVRHHAVDGSVRYEEQMLAR